MFFYGVVFVKGFDVIEVFIGVAIDKDAETPGLADSVLASPAANEWVHHHAAGSGLGAGTVRLNPRLLAGIPLH